jgi:hypothetical protein
MEKLLALFEGLEPGSSERLKRFLEEGKFKYETGVNKLVYNPGLKLTEKMFCPQLFRLIHCLARVLIWGFTGLSQIGVLNLQITYREQCCGDTRPSEEMERQAQTVKPQSQKIKLWYFALGRCHVC